MTDACSCTYECSSVDDKDGSLPMCQDRPTVSAEDANDAAYFALLGLLDVKEQANGVVVYRVRCPHCDHDTGWWHGTNPDHVARRAHCHIVYNCKEAPDHA